MVNLIFIMLLIVHVEWMQSRYMLLGGNPLTTIRSFYIAGTLAYAHVLAFALDHVLATFSPAMFRQFPGQRVLALSK